jgi:hypothetical protein
LELNMQTYEIQVAGGRKAVNAIRWELFVFDDVRDVLATDGPDTITIVYRGNPSPAEWLETLDAAGYALIRSQQVAGSEVDTGGPAGRSSVAPMKRS